MLDSLGAKGELILESVHNFLDGTPPSWEPDDRTRFVHRKGALPAREGSPLIIPGSRGAHSYLVMPTGNHPEAGWSISHGAGRKMSRSAAAQKLKRGVREWGNAVSFQKLQRTKFGSLVVCDDRALLMEENPEAYKPIDRVVQDLVDHGLVKVLALFKPLLTFKHKKESKTDKHSWKS
jgi:release factor H-coupled RctB family protein